MHSTGFYLFIGTGVTQRWARKGPLGGTKDSLREIAIRLWAYTIPKTQSLQFQSVCLCAQGCSPLHPQVFFLIYSRIEVPTLLPPPTVAMLSMALAHQLGCGSEGKIFLELHPQPIAHSYTHGSSRRPPLILSAGYHCHLPWG